MSKYAKPIIFTSNRHEKLLVGYRYGEITQ